MSCIRIGIISQLFLTFIEPVSDCYFTGNPGLGLSLSLEDFGSEAQAPHWLPQDRWENVMAISVLPGPLDNLCVKIAENSDTWHTWYKSDTPERQMVEGDDNQTEDTSTARGMSLLPAMSDKLKAKESSNRLTSDLAGPTTYVVVTC